MQREILKVKSADYQAKQDNTAHALSRVGVPALGVSGNKPVQESAPSPYAPPPPPRQQTMAEMLRERMGEDAPSAYAPRRVNAAHPQRRPSPTVREDRQPAYAPPRRSGASLAAAAMRNKR